MIIQLQNNKPEVAKQIHLLFQLSYTVEAELLKVTDFPPLKRLPESYQFSKNTFYGFFENNKLLGAIELCTKPNYLNIDSLVVKPSSFKRGIASKLINFVFDNFNLQHFRVETALNNIPATTLYKKLGFRLIKQWDTPIGIKKLLFEKRVDLN